MFWVTDFTVREGEFMRFWLAASLVALLLVGGRSSKSEEIGSVGTNGILFKDQLVTLAFDDEEMGVTCYFSVIDRTLSMSDSSDSHLQCLKLGPTTGKLEGKSDIFSQSKSMLRSTKVDRQVDLKRNVLIYVSYTPTKVEEVTKHGMSVVPIAK